MTGKCPNCGTRFTVPGRRGTKISSHTCPDCGVPLQGVTAGTNRGRYQCPITGYTIVLGQAAAAQLTEPLRLEFRPGIDLRGTARACTRTQPDEREQRYLNRVAGRVLGPGAVVLAEFDPHRHDDKDDAFRTEQLQRAGLYLVPADDPGNPADWIVNGKLTYRACTACGNQTPDVPDARVPQEWQPRRTQIWRGRNRHTRRAEPINQGPHPASSLACSDCDPRPRA
jgi:hypothetical protein